MGFENARWPLVLLGSISESWNCWMQAGNKEPQGVQTPLAPHESLNAKEDAIFSWFYWLDPFLQDLNLGWWIPQITRHQQQLCVLPLLPRVDSLMWVDWHCPSIRAYAVLLTDNSSKSAWSICHNCLKIYQSATEKWEVEKNSTLWETHFCNDPETKSSLLCEPLRSYYAYGKRKRNYTC